MTKTIIRKLCLRTIALSTCIAFLFTQIASAAPYSRLRPSAKMNRSMDDLKEKLADEPGTAIPISNPDNKARKISVRTADDDSAIPDDAISFDILRNNLNRIYYALKGTKIYMTCGVPCTPCLIEIINAGIEEMIVTKIDGAFYDQSSTYLLKESQIPIRTYDFIKE